MADDAYYPPITYHTSLIIYQRVCIYYKTTIVRHISYVGRYDGGVFFV